MYDWSKIFIPQIKIIRINRITVSSQIMEDVSKRLIQFSEEYQKYPIETLLANSLGSLKMLELARNEKSKSLYIKSF